MILAVLLTRRSHLKTLSPVIDAAVARGHETLLVAQRRRAKPGDALDVTELGRLWPAARIVSEVSWWVDALIGLEGALPARSRVRLIGVDPFYDVWLRPPRPDVTMCYASEYHLRKHMELHGERVIGRLYEPSVSVAGWLPSDQAALLHGDRLRDSAVFFSLKLNVPEPWRQSKLGHRCYRALAEQARDLARAEGLRFVVKSRAKNGDPWWLRRLADAYVLDECMVPYTSLSLLARAKWCVHFESGAAFEAVLMGAYGLAIRVPQSHVVSLPGGALNFGHAAWNDWPGVAQYGLPTGRVPALAPEARTRYLDTFLGPCDGKVGQRIVEIAEGT